MATKSWTVIFPDSVWDRRTSTNRLAMRSVWNNGLPPAVRVLVKNVRARPVALIGLDGREGLDIAGAKALRPFASHLARLKSCPDTSCLSEIVFLRPLKSCPGTSYTPELVLLRAMKLCPETLESYLTIYLVLFQLAFRTSAAIFRNSGSTRPSATGAAPRSPMAKYTSR